MRCKAEEWSVSVFASSMHGNSKISDCICEDDAMGLALHQLRRERRSTLCLIDSGWQKISRHEYSVLILQTCLGIGRALKRQFRSDGERKDLGLNFWSPCMTLMLILLRSFWIKDPLFFSIYVDNTTQSTRTMHSLYLPQQPHATLRGQRTEPHPFPITNRPLTVLGGVWMNVCRIGKCVHEVSHRWEKRPHNWLHPTRLQELGTGTDRIDVWSQGNRTKDSVMLTVSATGTSNYTRERRMPLGCSITRYK